MSSKLPVVIFKAFFKKESVRYVGSCAENCVVIFRCKLRVVDSFGTEAQFNFNQYKEKVDGGSMGAFGRYNLNLRQFQTMFRKILSVFSSIDSTFHF